MDAKLDAVCKSLDKVSKAILDGWSGDQTFLEAWGWNCAAITRHDLAAIPSGLAARIRSADTNSIEPALSETLSLFPNKLQLMVNNTLPQLYGGNNAAAVTAILCVFELLEKALLPVFEWKIADSKTLPPQLSRRLRAINAELDGLVPDKDSLKQQLDQISQANLAAESLPVDLQALKEARVKIDKTATDSAVIFGRISESGENAAKATATIQSLNQEAQKLVKNCEAAYSITTTKGLAGAFQVRADRLGATVWVWVLLLVVALCSGSVIGYHRIEALTQALASSDPPVGALWLQFALSALSVGAPLWFAWLSTKQIGQRFKLAEDYAFKATVAKAYEGYRREAVRIDPALETRLFSSTLDRFDEAPLRLVESVSHGGPWSEILESKAASRALELFPDSKNKIVEIIKDAVQKAGPHPLPPDIDK